LKRLSPAWVNAIPARLYGDAREYLAGKIDGASAFALEDPYLCRLWPFWLKVLDEAGVRVVAIHVLQRPGEVNASPAYEGLSPEDCAALWTRCTVEAEAIPVERILIACDAMHADPRAVSDRVRRWLSECADSRLDDEIGALLQRIGRHDAVCVPLQGSIGA